MKTQKHCIMTSFTKFLAVLGFLGSSVGASAQYCTPAHTSTCAPYITEVKLSNKALGSVCSSGSGYGDYSGYSPTSLVRGEAYTISVKTAGASILENVSVWFDWNNDEVFSVSERVILIGTNLTGHSALFIVPNDAELETLSRYRVRVSDVQAADDPCETLNKGETEDHAMIVSDPNLPQCAENLSPKNGKKVCQHGVKLEWGKPTTGGDPVGYRVYVGKDGNNSIVNGVETADSSLTITAALLPDSTYEWYVVPFNEYGEALACSDPETFQVNSVLDPEVHLSDTAQTFCVGENQPLAAIVAFGNGDSSLWDYQWTSDEIITNATSDTAFFNPTESGEFIFALEVVDDSGCVAMDSMEVVVLPDPNVPILGSVLDYCFPLEYTIHVDSTYPVLGWEAAGDNVHFVDVANSLNDSLDVPEVNGKQYYRVKLLNGNCLFTSQTIATTGHPSPDQPVFDLEGLDENFKFCANDSAVITITNHNEFAWSTGATEDSIVIDEAGDYVFTVVDEFCSMDTTFTIGENPFPIKPILNTGDNAVLCPNAELKLYPDFKQPGVMWSDGSQEDTLSATQIGVYYLTITNEFGCTNKSNETFVTHAEDFDIPEVEAPLGIEVCKGSPVMLEVTNYNSGISWNDETTTFSRTVFVDVADEYIATYTSAEGCTFSSDPFEVINKGGIETPEIIASPENGLCIGSMITLTVDNYEEASWNTNPLIPAKFIEVLLSQTYTASVEVDGCTVEASYSLKLNVPPLIPVIQTNQNDLVVNPNLASRFIWFLDGVEIPGENNAYITPEAEGVYTVIGANGGCWGPESFGYNWGTSGIGDDIANNQLNIYPNPSTGEVHFANASVNSTYKVYDFQGREVGGFTLSASQEKVDLSYLDKGTYVIRNEQTPEQFTRLVKM